MIIGVPKEIKEQEYRVALPPSGAYQLSKRGHQVLVERGAGVGSGFADEEYSLAGAAMMEGAEAVFARAELIVKVKEPQLSELPLLRSGQLLFTYLHLAADKTLTENLLRTGVTAIAYETVEVNHRLPLLEPMNAARMATGLGADVTILEVDIERMRYLDITLHNAHTLYSDESRLLQMLPGTDLLIGAVLVPGAKAPRLIRRDMLQLMRPGSVLVDNLGPWFGGLQWRDLGPYPVTDGPQNPQDKGYSEVNVDLGYKVTAKFKVQLSVYNLLNDHADAAAYYYTSRLTPGLSSPEVTGLQVHPLEPISGRLEATYLF